MHPDDRFIIIVGFFIALSIGFLSAQLGVFIGGISTIVCFGLIWITYKRLTKWQLEKKIERRKHNEN